MTSPELLRRIAELPPDKRAQLQELLARQEARRSETSPPPGSTGEPATDGSRPSFGQERLWFLAQLEPESPAYNIPTAVRFQGRLRLCALGHATSEVVRRHPSLGTVFEATAEGPRIHLRTSRPASLPVVDLGDLGAGHRSAELERLLDDEALRPFDLTRGPLWRALVVRLDSTTHAALLSQHHAVSDGWSMGIYLREISCLYGSYAQGRPSVLPSPPTSYAELAAAQRRRRREPAQAESLAFWRERLADVPVLELPTDRPRPPVPSGRGARLRTRIPTPRVSAMDRLAREHEATRFMVLLAAFEALLARISGQWDFAVGTPVANRTSRARDVIGFFVNTLALRADTARIPRPTFRQLIEHVRGTVLDAFAHQEIPFERLVEHLQPERSLAVSPLFQVMLVLQSLPPARLDLPDVTFEVLERSTVATKLDLTLGFGERDGALEGAWDFARDLFDATTVRRLDGSLTILLDAALESPDRPLDALPLVTVSERHQVLVEWSVAAGRRSRPGGWIDAVRRRAAEHPERTAVVSAGRTWSYRQLAEEMDHRSRRLRQAGAGLETVVAVEMPRTPEMLATLLAVLRVGAAYLPLDPAHPAERRRFVREDAGARWAWTPRGLEHLENAPPKPEPASNEELDAAAAYLLYTSGSTGKPKGVVVPRRAVEHFLAAMTARPGLTARDVVVAVTTPTFDISVFDLFAPLTVGARVVMATEEEAADGRRLAALLDDSEATLLQATPATWRLLTEAGWRGRPGLTALTGGEALAPELAHRLRARTRAVWNLYGPTEATVYAAGGPVEDGPVTLGRPLERTATRVLDDRLEPVPVGVPGELWLAGAGLARGYRGRSAGTAESFRPDPFSAEPGRRMYRTGDRVRWTPDGRLMFLGRLDDQVKIRGFRIELGEIEAAMTEHPDVDRAAVVLRGAGVHAGLATFYVARDPRAPVEPSDLRAFLARRLPEYMIPATFVPLEALPQTGSGKVDRRSLASRAEEIERPRGEHRTPRTPTEERLAELWQDVLDVERVGALDDFFVLGGHSLLAARLTHRLREQWNVDLPVRRVFQTPVLEDLAAYLEAGVPASDAGSSSLPPPTPRPDDGPAPLSYSQERLFFLDRLEPGSPVYNVPLAVRLEGRLQTAALAGAVFEVVRRHPVLRSVLWETEPGPRQEPRPAEPGRVPVVDLAGLAPGDAETREDRLSELEALAPFDWSRGPLWRGRLLRRGRDRHAALFTQHHVVSDAWSMGVFLREIGALYDAFVHGRPSPLPEPELTYADVAVWQRTHLAGPALEARLATWEARLADLPDLELPTDRPRPAAPSRRGGEVPVHLPAGLVERLTARAQEQRASLFMALWAAFQGLLARLSGQTDFGVGTPVANRPHSKTEGVIGFFVNTLVLRADASRDPTFAELLDRARETALTAFADEDVPFERLVERLDPERSLASSPLFQVLLALQNAPAGRTSLPGLEIAPLARETKTSKLDLSLNLGPRDGGLAGRWVFARDLLDETTVRRWSRALRRLLEAALADPDARLSALPLTTPAERHQVLLEWNDGSAVPLEGAPLLHERIHAGAGRFPDRVALVDGDGSQVTYGELSRRARSLAERLDHAGAGPEVPVWVLAGRSPQTVIGLLAVLTAGSFYVPVDPDYPEDRVETLLADAEAPLVLASAPGRRRHGRRLAALGARVVELEASPTATGASFVPRGPVEPGRAAYAIYTSGSTGRPKGVLVSHGAVTPRLEAARREGMDDGERVLHKASVSFDVSVFEIFAPLLLGARVHGVPPGGTEDVGALLDRMVREEITHVSFPPSLLASLLGEDGLGRCPALRRVMTGGETVPADLPERFSRRLPIPLFNRYGPTEATISVTEERVTGRPPGDGPLPIGRPIHGARVHVLDDLLEPVPLGAAGEICLGGPSLARGYFRRPAATAAAFRPHPLADAPGDRLYRTGDLGRWRPDGALMFLGRADGQVKIRGHRVELGDVEAALLSHGAVSEAAVVDRPEPATGTRSLAAWVVPAGHLDAGDPGPLRRHLADRLPAYMIPSAWGFLEALPVTPHGKVDRKRLADLEPDAEAAEHVAPRTPTEELVAEAWNQVLGVERVGATDDFFDLGGHSLLATRVVARLREAFGVELPVRALFEHSTVEGLADALDGLRADPRPPAPPLVPRAESGPAPLSFAQERFWFLAHLDPDSAVYTIPAALEIRGPVAESAVAQSLGEIVRRHEVLRAALPTGDLGDDETPAQEIRPPGTVRPRSVDLSGLAPEDRQRQARRLGAAHARRPFDLGSPPLLRVALLRHAPDRRTALFAMHHAVSDAWSMGVLVRELTALAREAVRGRPSPLPELSIQYPDVALWQRSWLHGEVLERQVGFWRRLLAGTPEALELPTDRPRPPVTTSRGATTAVALSGDASRGLEALGRQLGVTPFMLLLAAWAVGLARTARQARFAAGTPVAGRTRVETEPLIGLFLNTLPLPVDVADDPPFPELLRRIRETTLDAFAHQDVPFEKLVDELEPERSLARTPLFQVFLVVQNVEPAHLEIPGATLAPVDTPQAETKFELTLTASRRPDGLRLALAYKTDLFDATTARRLLRSLKTLLHGILEAPERHVSELPLLEAAQRHQVLSEWNDTAADLPGGCLHELFDAQTQRAPEAPAVRSGDRTLTYAELRRGALALAHDLRSRGVGPETVVALFLDRSPELVLGMLGVLYAGGAYLPLDPTFPADRIQNLVEDAGAPVILTRQALTVPNMAPVGTEILCLDPYSRGPREEGRPGTSRTDRNVSERSEFEDRPPTSPGGLPASPDPDLPAYVIYTSGSTGRPKGVILPHRPVVLHLQAYARTIGWRSGAGFAMVQSPSVDAPVTNVWLALTTGGCLHLLSPEEATDPRRTEAAFRTRGIEALKLAPSHFKALQSGENPRDVIPSGWLILGGEALPTRDARRLAATAPPSTRIYGSYGPTEAAVAMLSARVDGADFDAQPAVFPLGRPIPRTRALILDPRLEPVPVGALGEIVIAGHGLARGYLGRPGRTAAAFVPDPYAEDPGARMYRTGDLARFLADGRVEFQGRLDQQIKIRGFRIEPGEVEAALRRLDGVAGAVVQAQEDPAGHPALVAWVVPSSLEDAETAETWMDEAGPRLRRALEAELPVHMVPSILVPLAALPRTPHGKLDRKALPAPSWTGRRATGYVAPSSPLEEQLAEIWADVLGVERVGVEDDFFDLGGHSLLAIRLVSRIRRDLGLELPLRRFFGATTVADLARLLWQAQAEHEPDDELERMLGDLEDLTDEEAEALLAADDGEAP